jgi:hypothetical protein
MEIEENSTNTSTENKDEFGQTASAPNSSPATENSDNSSLKQTIKDTAGSAAGQVKDKAATAIDEQKSKVALGLSSVADELRKAGGNLRDSEGGGGDDKNYLAQQAARYGETLADKVEGLSGYLENASVKDLARDLEGFARRQPALFVGGALIAGILAARFLKSSAPKSGSQSFLGSNSANNKSGNDFADSENVLQDV